MKRSIWIAALAALLMLPALSQAQTAPVKLELGKTYQFAADHDGVNTVSYHVLIDGARVGADIPVSALASGVITTPTEVTSTLTPGLHRIQFVAVNASGEAKSAPLEFDVPLPLPKPPSNLRFIVVVTIAENGAVSFRLEEVKAVDAK